MRNAQQIVFATNFSDACYRAIPAVASWMDTLKAKLTILHVCDPKKGSRLRAETYLKSFFAEADLFGNCERVLRVGDPYREIARFASKNPGSLLVLPPSDRVGFPRPFHRSIRARLLKEHGCPVWTIGRTSEGKGMNHAEEHIACWIEKPEDGLTHVREAATLAERRKAVLHLLCTVPSLEDMDEGALGRSLDSTRPLGAEYAESWMTSIADTLGVPYDIHIALGNAKRELPKLLRQSGSTVLLVSRDSALQHHMFGVKLHPALDACDHAVICFPPACRLFVVTLNRKVEAA